MPSRSNFDYRPLTYWVPAGPLLRSLGKIGEADRQRLVTFLGEHGRPIPESMLTAELSLTLRK